MMCSINIMKYEAQEIFLKLIIFTWLYLSSINMKLVGKGSEPHLGHWHWHSKIL
jgi:hypothetical protein